jgi:hypothetical protein
VAIFERKLPLALLLLLLSLSESGTLGLLFELATAAALPVNCSEKLSTLLLLLPLLPATSVTPIAGCGGGELDESNTMHSISGQRVKWMSCTGSGDRLYILRGNNKINNRISSSSSSSSSNSGSSKKKNNKLLLGTMAAHAAGRLHRSHKP